ncbi:MAG: DUF6713 family protein [Bacteroidota bacterium]
MNENLLFITAVACILTHEMDAIRCKEWTLFPGLHLIQDEKLAYQTFTLLHIPLYILLFWGVFGTSVVAENVVIGLDIFFMVHIGLHILALWHPKNQFTDWLSWLAIGGAGLFGGLDLLMRS